MAACLMALFLAISASNAASNPSTTDNASAMARCSALFGGRRECWRNYAGLPNGTMFVLALTVLSSSIKRFLE